MKAITGYNVNSNKDRYVNVSTPSGQGPRRKNPVASPPTTVEVRGVPIHFPFRPYKCQEDYMGKVLDAVLRSENALLESPTGTGKTLCLLCATLAWQREQVKNAKDRLTQLTSSQSIGSQQQGKASSRPPVIIYASRTHSQLSQVVRELRNTRYRPRHAVLGSREQMCVNPKVKKKHSTGSDINHDCNKLGKERKCHYRNNLDNFVAPSDEGNNIQAVMDMEDLVSMGKSHRICPFYHTRSHIEDAELVLLPYNYLFEKDSRTTTLADIPWNNAVVIFDEAHNLESFATDSASFDLSNTDIAGCIIELTRVTTYLQMMTENGPGTLSLDNVVKLKALLLNLEEYLLNLNNQGAYSGEFMMEILKNGAAITYANHHLFVEEVRKVSELMMDIRGSASTKGAPHLENFVTCVKRVYGESTEARCFAKASSYRVHITPKQSSNQSTASRTVSYWCFAPSLAMQEIANLNVRSILVTSGTLSPLPSYSMELGLSFPHTLENPHIISDSQIHVRVIGKGVSGKHLTSSYGRRQDGEYYIELGNTLVSLAKIIPAGMLIFFPSYGVMATCLERWGGPSNSRPNTGNSKAAFFAQRRKSISSSNKYSFPCTRASHFVSSSSDPSTPWKRLLNAKSIVIEPKATSDLPDAIAEFHKYLNMPKSPGCVLMGVCRGKISEGIDFAHDMSRAVIITGLPFPPSHDAKVKLKREYLDGIRVMNSRRSSESGGFGDGSAEQPTIQKLSGNAWYTQQAHRAVNQAIGRVIRNKSDYGAILLLDSRFEQPQNHNGLSKWVRPHLQKDQGMGVAIGSLAKFYREARARAEEEAKAPPSASTRRGGIVLKYEHDGKVKASSIACDDEEFTKIAFIRNEKLTKADEKKAEDVLSLDRGDKVISPEGEQLSYIPPERVIARMDVKNMQKSGTVDEVQRREANVETKSKSGDGDELFSSRLQSFPQRNTALGRTNRAEETASIGPPESVPPKSTSNSAQNSKAQAVQFFRTAQSLLSPIELSAIRKAIVSMKAHGDRKDARSYLRSAHTVVKIIVGYETFQSKNRSGKSMLFLFFVLLPRIYRRDVEMMAMKVLFDRSGLSNVLKANLSPEDFKNMRSRISNILCMLWCDDQKGPCYKTNYLSRAQTIFRELNGVDNVVISKFVEEYSKLIPPHLALATHALAEEMKASNNINRMKKQETKFRGEDSLQSFRFRTTSTTNANPATITPAAKSTNEVALELKRKRTEPGSTTSGESRPFREKPNSTASGDKIRMPLNNPYARPVKAVRSVAVTKEAKSNNPDSISKMLRQAESQIFVKKSSGDIARQLKSNAPKNLKCTICDKSSKEPLVGECGHMACQKCWVQWLKRSQTCPVCRVETKKESLARAVFEKSPGSGAPSSLSQMCRP